MANKEIRLVEAKVEAQCHLMPCRIEHNETTIKAREYFWPTIRKLQVGDDDEDGREKGDNDRGVFKYDDSNPIFMASFRGRPLQGRKVTLPDSYRGYALVKNSTSNKQRNKACPIDSKFSEFTYWNWDELPTNDDKMVKAFGWINVANAIHKPVCDDDT